LHRSRLYIANRFSYDLNRKDVHWRGKFGKTHVGLADLFICFSLPNAPLLFTSRRYPLFLK
jgi:hypothetical protein